MMNGVLKAALKLSTIRVLTAPLKTTIGKREITRTLWHMSKTNFSENSINSIHKPSFTCSCGCGIQRMHTKGNN